MMLPVGWVFSLLTHLLHPAQPPEVLNFELRHLHTVSQDGRILFSDSPIPHSTAASTYSLYQRSLTSYGPSSFATYTHARKRSMTLHQSERLEWKQFDATAPDVQKRETLLQLAKMANDAYFPADTSDPGWYDLGGQWRNTSFGWEPDADGMRGQIFATPNNDTVVLAIKGTSASITGGGGPTVRKDKLNDNLLFSCCCSRVDWTWTTVCGCYRGAGKCDLVCLENSLMDDDLYYNIGTNLYNNLTYMYPEANIWITGHSLGAALAGLLGATFGAPVVTFESPGERMAARRLHLPSPPSTHHITHVYHTADPIAMGVCNGLLSTCALGGYAMESRCHLGKSIIYDTVSELSWSVDIRTHGIVNVIEKLLSEEWKPSVDQGREVPEAIADGDDCVDCYAWEFLE